MNSPSKLLLSLELPRGIIEYGSGLLNYTRLINLCEKGDDHPVIVFPGLAGSDLSTFFMRSFLKSIGYKSYSWGKGLNLGPRDGLDSMLNDLSDRIEEISKLNNDSKVSLVGWSLGGVYARELSKIRPELTRQVITLGTPFKNLNSTSTNAEKLYEILSKDKSYEDPEVYKRIEIRPSVPFTSIYSKTDGVVLWNSSLEDLTPISENVEITGASHLGLGHNPKAMYVIADRLAQSIDDWRPFNKF